MHKGSIHGFLIILLLALGACSAQANHSNQAETQATSIVTNAAAPLHVVATTGQIADTVRHIAGNHIQLTNLLGPGIDPHTYIATEGDIVTFQQADVILYNGLRLEAQMERMLEQIGQNDAMKVVAVANTLDLSTLIQWEPEAGLPYDPHVWNDVQLWIQITTIIRDTLIAADPTQAHIYTDNTAAYIKQLEDLHTYMLQQADRLPQERRVLVTAHDAFSYFGRAYGFTVEAVQGISTESEAGVADIQTLAAIVVAHQTPAMFIETTISPRTIEAVQEAIRAQGYEVKIGGQLFSDAMGEPGSPAETYIGMMRHNIDTIVSALRDY